MNIYRKTIEEKGVYLNLSVYYNRDRKTYTGHVQPLLNAIRQDGNFTIREYDPMEGVRTTLLKVNRASKANEQKAIEAFEAVKAKMIEQALGNVAKREKAVTYL